VTTDLRGDPTRVYLTGQSMGGHGAWTFAAQQPRFFAAVAVVCGYAQGSEQEEEIARRLARGHSSTAVCVYHSADDSVIPVSAADGMVKALAAAAAQGSEVRYVRYQHAPGPPISEYSALVGHGSYEIAYRDAALYEWLLRHQCDKCGRPLARWHELPPPPFTFG